MKKRLHQPKIIDNEEFELMKLNRLKNMELKALISMKINTAKQAKLKVIVDVPEVFILDTSIDLVVVIRLLAILLDNAIENSKIRIENVRYLNFQ